MSTVHPPPETAQFCEVLGARIKKLRSARGMSQAAMAEAAGVSRATVTQIENGQQAPSMTTLAAVGRVLDLPLATFFREVRDPAPAGSPVTASEVRAIVREELGRFLARAGADGLLLPGGPDSGGSNG